MVSKILSATPVMTSVESKEDGLDERGMIVTKATNR